jgi:hypothetical protein
MLKHLASCVHRSIEGRGKGALWTNERKKISIPKSYQLMLQHLAGCVHRSIEGGSEEDGVEVAGETEEDLRGEEGPHAQQQAPAAS